MRLKLDSRFWIPDKVQTAQCLDQHNDGRNVTWIKSEQTHIYKHNSSFAKYYLPGNQLKSLRTDS